MMASLDRVFLIILLLAKPWVFALVIGFFAGGVLTLENSRVNNLMVESRDLAYRINIRELIEDPSSAADTLEKMESLNEMGR